MSHSHTRSTSRPRSPSASNVSETTKRKVRTQTKQRCWLCRVYGSDVAHLLEKSDNLLFQLHITNGLVKDDTDIHSEDNLVFLCGTCHKSFDLGTPAWVFLPYPLKPFLTAEQAFQAARQNDPSVSRTPFSRDNLLFQPYLIREGHLAFPWDKLKGPLKWPGEPILAILRSYAIAAGLQRLPVEDGGVPQDVAEMYLELVGLYGTATPVTGTITVQEPDTIRVLIPDETVGMVGPPQMPMGGNNLPGEPDVEVVIPVETTGTIRSISTHQSGNKRHAPWNDESECPSIDTINRSVMSNNTQLTGVPWK